MTIKTSLSTHQAYLISSLSLSLSLLQCAITVQASVYIFHTARHYALIAYPRLPNIRIIVVAFQLNSLDKRFELAVNYDAGGLATTLYLRCTQIHVISVYYLPVLPISSVVHTRWPQQIKYRVHPRSTLWWDTAKSLCTSGLVILYTKRD